MCFENKTLLIKALQIKRNIIELPIEQDKLLLMA